jgi:hypothetical protein
VWANSAIFKKLGIPLERNHPIGENWPNLVTLPMGTVPQEAQDFRLCMYLLHT